jgi:hypothetical protein
MYFSTKAILDGESAMCPVFTSFSNWIYDFYKSKPVNIVSAVHSRGNPEIIIVLKDAEEKSKLPELNEHDNPRIFEEDCELRNNFIRTINREDIHKLFKRNYTKEYLSGELLITVFSYDWVRSRAINDEIKQLCETTDNKDLWTVDDVFGYPVFFVYTEEQKEKYKDSEQLKKWTDEYNKIFMKYGLASTTYAKIDSKERFEKEDYGSWNWYFYKA